MTVKVLLHASAQHCDTLVGTCDTAPKGKLADNILYEERTARVPGYLMTFLSNKLFRTATPVLTALAIFLCASVNVKAAPDADHMTHSPDLWADAEPTGRLIVKYKTAENPKLHRRGPLRFKRKSWRNQHELKLNRPLSDFQELVTSDGNIDQLRRQARALSTQPYVDYASIEYRRYPLLQPNDPLYQGSLDPGDQSYLYDGIYSMHAPGAWDITTGSSSSIIAIVDTGILPNHPEIRDRSVEGLGYDFVSADGPQDYFSANDGDGRDNNPIDPGDPNNGGPSSWHGTAVASAAAGNSNNSEGIAGIDWNARLLHARALGIGGGTDADIIDAIRWSAGLPVAGVPNNANPANVVNLSLGGPTECTKAWQDVIDEMAELNVVFVMAAGNETNNALRSAPANCANVITVGSSTPGGTVDGGFSNYGLKVTIATGGRSILVASNQGFDSVNPNGNFIRKETGTSFSAALASGAISLMHSINPDLGPSQVRALLQESATNYASGSNCDRYYCGGGILNLARAMTMLRDGNFNADRDLAMELVTNQTTPIDLQQNTQASLFGYKDIRYFSVTASERGLLTAETIGSNDLFGYLLNSELSVIALDDDSGDSNNFRVAAVVDPGTYYVAVERSLHRLSDAELQFSLSTSLSNDTPSAFEFSSVSNATASSLIQSNSVFIEGLSDSSVLTVSNGFYSLNGGELINTPSTVFNGDEIQVATQTSGTENQTSIATITVGAYSTDFSVTTGDVQTLEQGGKSDSSSGCSIQNNGTLDPALLMLLVMACLGLYRPRRKVNTLFASPIRSRRA